MKHSFPVAAALFAICASSVPADGPAPTPAGADAPKVLLIGDSIEGGYAPFVQEALGARAKVLPVKRKKMDGSTDNAMREMDDWLASEHWAVIHFNWGLWDLKVVGKNGENSVPIEKYASNLRELVAKMKASGATLVFATTTPVPLGDVDTHRRPSDAVLYNAVALKIMEENQIHVDDLYALVLPRLAEFQSPSNVHFSEAGYRFMGARVAASVEFMLHLREYQLKKKK